MSKEKIRHEQLSFGFNKEYPSLLEPLRQKEKEFGASSPELMSLKIKLINFYLGKGDLNNAYKYLRDVIELIPSNKNDGIAHSQYFEKLSGPAAVIDRNIPGAGMVDRLDEMTLLKTRKKKERKSGVLNHVIILSKPNIAERPKLRNLR